jgi:zinc protease
MPRFRQIMTKAGARDNAGTGDDATLYYSTFAKQDLEIIVALYADMFQHLSYSEADFKTEARAILGEYNKDSANPLAKLFEVQRDRFYQAHTYKHTTMGFIKDIENMPNEYAYSKMFFERWYRPQYTTVIVAGDVAPEQVLPMVEKSWGGWKGGSATPAGIPNEPAPKGPIYVHVPWATDTLPLVTVGFPGPAFDEAAKDSAAMGILASLFFGQTSELYKKLLVAEQKVDQLQVDVPSAFDPSLFTVLARVKNGADAPYVRDQILSAVARARSSLVLADRLADAKSFDRYSFARGIDSTERVAAVVARYAAYRRSYQTVNTYYRTMGSLAPADLQSAARKYFDDRGLIVTTLSREPLPVGIERAPSLSSLEAQPTASASVGDVPLVVQKSPLPQLNVKLLWTIGSAHDPAGKEGLAALTAAMLTRAGSKAMTIDEIDAALYPTAASFSSRADKEMTTLTALVHRDQWQKVIPIVLPQLVDPGWRQEDFDRVKTRQTNALVQDLRSNNEEELGKERLQTNIFRGTPYGHVALGTVAGLGAITLDDVKSFARQMFTRANLTLAVSGDVPDGLIRDLQLRLRALPDGPAAPRAKIDAPRQSGIDVDDVNAAIARHLSARDLSVVIIAKDAAGLKQALVSDAFSPITYDGEKPRPLLDEDRVIGALKLNIAAARVRITPVAEVFAK